MFWPRNIVNNIDKLLDNPDITLNQVLQDSTFTNSIRSPSKKLTNFLLAENNLKQLINYSLTNDFEVSKNETGSEDDKAENERKRKEFNRLQRTSVLALTNQSKLFQNELITNELLKEKLINFPSSNYSTDPKICGHYSRIVETLLRTTSGKYLYQLPNIVDFLIKNVNVLPIRELFVVLFCEFTTIFIKCSSGSIAPQNNESSRADVDSLDESDDDSEESDNLHEEQTSKEERDAFFKKLLDNDQIKSGISTFFVFSAINGIFTQNDEYIRYFATSEFFTETLNIAISPDQKQLGAIEAFKVASRIMEWSIQNDPISTLKNEEISNIINEIEPKFNLPNRQSIDGITAFASGVFIASTAHLVTYLFEDNSNTFLNSSIFEAFKKLEWSDQLHLVREKNLLNRIISSFSKVDIKDDSNTSLYVKNDNGHITELADYLNTEFEIRKKSGGDFEDCKCFESDEWQNFVNNVLNTHINQRDTYDSVRSSSDSSEIDTEEVEVDYDDEEDDDDENFDEPMDKSSSDSDDSDADEDDEEDKKVAKNKKNDAELHSASDDDDVVHGNEVHPSDKTATKTVTNSGKNNENDDEKKNDSGN